MSETSSGGNPKFQLYAYKYEGGATLLHLAALSGNLSTISLLTSENVVGDLIEINSRMKAAMEHEGGSEGANNIKFANILKDALNAYDDAANTPIHMAALSGNVVMFEYMMYLGSDPKRLGLGERRCCTMQLREDIGNCVISSFTTHCHIRVS